MTIDLFEGIERQWSASPKDIHGLQQYLDTVWQERPLLLDPSERKESSQRLFDFTTNSIKARNYIGFVQYNDLRINVYPRVFYNPKNDHAVNSYIQNALQWLSYCDRIHFPFIDIQHDVSDFENWIEAFIFLFASYTEEVLNNAPHFAYQETTEEMQFIRGRIAMPEYIRHNYSTGRWHAFHCTFDPFVHDNLFNRIVKYTSKLLLQFTENRLNMERLSDILFTLEDVSDTPCTAKDCDRVTVNRLYPEIDKIRNMCKMFLGNENISASNNQNSSLSILLPMEVIFEQYVGGFIKEHFPEFEAVTQASDKYLATKDDQFNTRVFQMKHDILLPGKLIIDTKYKFRYKEDNKKMGVSQQDMYQMIVYCLKRDINRGLLLYPVNKDNDCENGPVTFDVGASAFSTSIQCESIDITEHSIGSFTENQKVKFQVLLESINKDFSLV